MAEHGSTLTSEPTAIVPSTNGARLRTRPAAPAAPPALNAAPDPLSLLQALRNRWRLAALLATLLAPIAAVVGWLVAPASYTAAAVFQISAAKPRLVFDTGEPRVNQNQFIQTQRALMITPLVLSTAIGKLSLPEIETLRDEPFLIEWLQQNLRIGTKGTPELLEVSLSGAKPEDLAKIINAVADAFIEQVVNADRNRRLKRMEDLEKVYAEEESQVRQREEAYRRLAERFSASDDTALALRQQFLIDDMRQLRTRKIELETQLQLLRRQASSPAGPAPIGAEPMLAPVPTDPELARYEEQIRTMDARIQEISVWAGPEHPSIVRMAAQRENLLAMAQRRRAEVLAAQANAVGEDATQPGVPENPIEAVEQQIKTVDARLAETEESLRLMGRSTELVLLRLQLEQDRQNLQTIRQQVVALDIELKADDGNRVTLFQRAEAPNLRDRDSRIRWAAIAALAAAGMSCAVVSLVEFRSRRITSVQDVELGLGLTALGVLPSIPGLARHHLRPSLPAVNASVWRTRLFNAVDGVRILLMHELPAREDGRIILISSAEAEEGKTSFSSMLAFSLARAGKRTVLVEADLRRPTMSEILEGERSAGLGEVLNGSAALHSVINRSEHLPGLHWIPAGHAKEAEHLISTTNLAPLFDQLRQQFDFVIVDSTPLLPVPDTLNIVPHVDATLLIVRTMVSRGPRVHLAAKRITAAEGKMLRCVVIGGKSEEYQSYSYSSYYHTQRRLGDS